MSGTGGEVAVVGGGLVGAACGAALAARGLRVRLLDPMAPQAAASFGNAGHIATEQIEPLASPDTLRAALGYLFRRDAPLALAPARLPSAAPWLARFVWAARPSAYARGVRALRLLQDRAMNDLRDLLDTAGGGELLHEAGHLLAFEDDGGEARELRRCARLGVSSRPAAPEDREALEARLGRRFAGLVHFPGSGHVDDPDAVRRALFAAVAAGGGELVRGRASAVRAAGAGYRVIADTGVIEAERVVLAAGAWSGPLARGLGVRAPLEVERGYHLTFPGHAPDLGRPVAFGERKVILTPMSCGLRIAGFVEFAGPSAPPRASRYALLRRHLLAVAPALALSAPTAWMGLRPSLPDHLPAIGPLPGHPRVIAAYGHQHLGLTLCGVTARLVADLAEGREPPLPLAPFRPGRF